MQCDYLYLSLAILAEVAATSALKAAAGFTKFAPSLIVVLGYGLAFYFLSLTLRSIPVGIAYAIWSGVGVIMVSVIGWMLYGQSLDMAAIAGILLIVIGVIVINLFSSVVPRA